MLKPLLSPCRAITSDSSKAVARRLNFSSLKAFTAAQKPLCLYREETRLAFNRIFYCRTELINYKHHFNAKLSHATFEDGKKEGSQFFSYGTWTEKSFLRVTLAYVTYTSV